MTSEPIHAREYECVCGFVSSRAGVSVHQRTCEDAIAYRRKGKSTMRSLIERHNMVKLFMRLTEEMGVDADFVIRDGNKSACRRARRNLSQLRKLTIPLRKLLLEAVKDDEES